VVDVCIVVVVAIPKALTCGIYITVSIITTMITTIIIISGSSL